MEMIILPPPFPAEELALLSHARALSKHSHFTHMTSQLYWLNCGWQALIVLQHALPQVLQQQTEEVSTQPQGIRQGYLLFFLLLFWEMVVWSAEVGAPEMQLPYPASETG